MKLNSQTMINILDCWLYDIIYRHVPQDQQPDLEVALRKVLDTKRPSKLAKVSMTEIEARLTKRLRSTRWRIPPGPCLEAKDVVPHWRQWKRSIATSQDPQGAGATALHLSSSETVLRPASSATSVSSIASKLPAQVLPPPLPPSLLQPPQSSATSYASQAGQPGKKIKKSHNFRDTGKYRTQYLVAPNQKTRLSSGTGYLQRIVASEPDTRTSELCEELTSIADKPLEGGWKRGTKSLLTMTDSLFPNETSAHVQDRHEIDKILSASPLFTSGTLNIDVGPEDHPGDVVIQSGIFAKIQQTRGTLPTIDPWGAGEPQKAEINNDILLLNTTTPWTTFICGLQGAGKSHSLSVIIENCLIPNKSIGVLARPLSALVLYYAPFTPVDAGKPCEVAYLAVPVPGSENSLPDGQGPSSARSVTVLASRSNLGNMKKVYEKIPGVTVRPLLFKPSQLTIKTMLNLMSVQQDNTALYLQVVTRILREMAAENPTGFDYEKFKSLLSEEPLTPMQWAPLELRLELLESFIGAEQNPNPFVPIPGGITIVDLTCPFVDAETACVLFSICLDLYSSAPSDTGKVVALDEAHKFMGYQTSSQQFANSVIQNIRLQRHLGLRTIISTQDPQVHPELLELSSFILMHRFDSPRWFATLRNHVGFDGKNNESASNEDEAEVDREAATTFQQIMRLNTGEAYLYCPQLATVGQGVYGQEIARLGNKLLKVRIRRRLTKDGGVSKNVL
ncbi:hypothetical protein ABW21_db0200481 [Orbilia brochopaga]|nr:hypothetical protein ABW21_db0200481 [Drechslerella brochopaga]